MESQLEIYSGISIFGYVLAAVFLVASVAIFFLMDIKGVYAYLSGKKQQKSIMEMREKQQNPEKGKPVPDSIKLGFSPPPKAEINNRPQAVVENPPPPVSRSSASETMALGGRQVESNNDATDVLNRPSFETVNESNDTEDYPTDVLNASNTNTGKFILIKNVMEIHTSEVL